MDKERLLEYIWEHFTVSGEAGRLIVNMPTSSATCCARPRKSVTGSNTAM